MSTPRRKPEAEQIPAQQPQVTPSPQSSSMPHGIDPAFIWTQLAELIRCNGTILESQRQLQSSMDRLLEKVDKIEDKVSGITHKVYAAGVVLTILVVVGGFFINKAWDMAAGHMADIAKASIQNAGALQSPGMPPQKK